MKLKQFSDEVNYISLIFVLYDLYDYNHLGKFCIDSRLVRNGDAYELSRGPNMPRYKFIGRPSVKLFNKKERGFDTPILQAMMEVAMAESDCNYCFTELVTYCKQNMS